MEPSKKKKHILRTLVFIILLAVFCISGTFLAFCRVNEPVLYHQLTDPARAVVQRIQSDASQQVQRVQAAAGEGLTRLQTDAEQLWEEVQEQAEAARATPTPTPEPELDQAAAPPAIEEPRVLAPYTVTEFTHQDGQEILTGGNVPIHYYNQADEIWAKQPFGPDPIDKYGCGPTALSMAVSSLTAQSVNPAEMAVWASTAGYCSPGHGSHLSIVPGGAEKFHLACRSLGVPTAEELQEVLSNGGLVVALMGPGHFTRNGHFILLRGVTLSGQVLVADPNSRENSLALWDPQIILDELTVNRVSGAPLWLMTVPDETSTEPLAPEETPISS